MEPGAFLCQVIIEFRFAEKLLVDEGMAAPAINLLDLLPDTIDLWGYFLEQFLVGGLPPERHLPVARVMAFDTAILDGIETILLLRCHGTVAVDAFNLAQLLAGPLLDSDASLPFDQPLDVDVTFAAADLLDLLSVMACRTILQKGLSMGLPGRMAVQTLRSIP